MSNIEHSIHVLLHDIRSAHNVGAMLRTGDAIGVTKFYFSGFTPTPLDKFHRPVKEIAKTALGAEKTIAWQYDKSPFAIIAGLKNEGYLIIGLEQDARAVDYKSLSLPTKALVIVGSEVEGMLPSLRELCDVLLDIPMKGNKESLNVATAFGILMFRVFDR
jgi:23S rRNA (guanosine2251-2'-O)-methyltransferase